MSSPSETAAPPRDWAVATLREAGCAEPEADADLLIADGGDLRAAVLRRAAREPLGYVRGRTSFRGLEIGVDPRVFIPRPETELLVEAALAIPRGARVLEPCTGSGAVAIALKHERPDLDVTASDRSPDALAVARANAERLGIDVAFVEADGIAGVPGGPWDAIVSNPPYVAEAEAGTGSLPAEIEFHEPPGAFWAGDDGLSVYARFATELGDAAWVAFEIGDGQEGAVASMFEAAGLRTIDFLRVPSGHARVVRAVR